MTGARRRHSRSGRRLAGTHIDEERPTVVAQGAEDFSLKKKKVRYRLIKFWLSEGTEGYVFPAVDYR